MKRQQVKEEDQNLIEMFRLTGKIIQFENMVKEEVKDHPDYKADEVSLDSEHISIVLKRWKCGVLHSMYIEVDFDDAE